MALTGVNSNRFHGKNQHNVQAKNIKILNMFCG